MEGALGGLRIWDLGGDALKELALVSRWRRGFSTMHWDRVRAGLGGTRRRKDAKWSFGTADRR